MSDLYTDMKALEGKSVYANGFVDGYEQGKKDAASGKWISVKEKYPEMPCIFLTSDGEVEFASSVVTFQLSGGGKMFVHSCFFDLLSMCVEEDTKMSQEDIDRCTHYTHWQPLPEPPKMDAQEGAEG